MSLSLLTPLSGRCHSLQTLDTFSSWLEWISSLFLAADHFKVLWYFTRLAFVHSACLRSRHRDFQRCLDSACVSWSGSSCILSSAAEYHLSCCRIRSLLTFLPPQHPVYIWSTFRHTLLFFFLQWPCSFHLQLDWLQDISMQYSWFLVECILPTIRALFPVTHWLPYRPEVE